MISEALYKSRIHRLKLLIWFFELFIEYRNGLFLLQVRFYDWSCATYQKSSPHSSGPGPGRDDLEIPKLVVRSLHWGLSGLRPLPHDHVQAICEC